MYHQGQVYRVLDGGDQVIGGLGGQNTGHVLDADGAHAHAGHFLDHAHILVQGVDRAGGVGDSAGSKSAAAYRLLNGDLQVVDVVEGIENAHDVDAVFHRGADKAAHNVVRVVLVAQNVLATQQHLQLGVGHLGADLSQPLPGVLVQVAQAHVKGGSAPAFHRVESGLIHGLQYGLELVIAQTGGHQGLVGVAQHGFGKLYFHGSSCILYFLYFKEKF